MLNKRLFTKLPLFKDLSDLAMVNVVQKMKPVFHLPGQLIITEGTDGNALYFINRGSVEVLKEGKVRCHCSVVASSFAGSAALRLRPCGTEAPAR